MAANFKIKRNDTYPPLDVTLEDGDGNVPNLVGATVRFHMKSQAGALKVDRECNIINELTGAVRYQWQPEDTDTDGSYYGEWEVTMSDDRVATFPNDEKPYVILISKDLA